MNLFRLFFWLWGGALVTLLVVAISVFLLSLGIKALDQTEVGKMAVLQFQMEVLEDAISDEGIILDVDTE